MAEQIAHWTDILTKANPSDLEGRLRRAYRLYGLSRTVDRPELDFILLAVGLETMLLGKGDRDYLRQRLAEKAAFLVATDKDARIEVYESVKALYDKRSGFVHSGSGSVTEEDVREINRVFWEVVRAIYRLLLEGHVAIDKTDEARTIDDLIEGLRFC